MRDESVNPPSILQQIQRESELMGFQMASDPLTGSLLRTLAATKPVGKFLELGTGTGIATAWLLDGMDKESRLLTVEQDREVASIARKYLGHDNRVTFHIEDAASFLNKCSPQEFDLIFADTWSGKYFHLNETLNLVKVGGIYVVDDMLPQTNWPENHPPKVERLITVLEDRRDLIITKMNWATGLIVAGRVSS